MTHFSYVGTLRHLCPFHILMVFTSFVLLCAFGFPAGIVTAQSYCLSIPQLEVNSNRVYGLVGPPSDGFANDTIASVIGVLVPYNPSGFINPTPNYDGTIYVSSLQANQQTFSYSSNPPQSGEAQVAATSTITTQGLTMVAYIFTTVSTEIVMVQGTLFYNQVPCVSTLNQQNPGMGITSPSFIVEILTVIVVLLFVISRKQKK